MRWQIFDNVKHKEVTPRRRLSGEDLKEYIRFYFFKHYDLEFVNLTIDSRSKTVIISLRKDAKQCRQ